MDSCREERPSKTETAAVPAAVSPAKTKRDRSDDEHENVEACKTPKGERFRIPEITTCPPAPKKRRLMSPLQKTPITFFLPPPDVELFFTTPAVCKMLV